MHFLIVVVAAAVVAILHSVLPDHWVPIAVVARANRWSLQRTAKTSLWAAGGHVISSLIIGAVIIAVGTGVKSLIAVQGKVVGIVLIVTGMGLLVWALWQRRSGHGHHHGHGHPHPHPHGVPGEQAHETGHAPDHPHSHEHAAGEQDHPHPHEHAAEGEHVHPHPHEHPATEHDHPHPHDHGHTHPGEHEHTHGDDQGHPHSHEHGHSHAHDHEHAPAGPVAAGTPAASKGWAASLAVPFGVAASPDLTILPVFLAASAISLTASVTVVLVFSVATLATFVGLTVAATAGGYRVEWPWFERNAEVVSSAVLIVLGIAAYLAL